MEIQIYAKENTVRNFILIVASLMFLVGCAPIPLGGTPEPIPEVVGSVVDDRPEELKQAYSIPFTSRKTLAETDFEPLLFEYFKSLIKANTSFKGNFDIRVDKLVIEDNFPKRLRAANAGGFAGAGFVTLGSVVAARPVDTDFVICKFKGSINGKAIDLGDIQPYQPTGETTLIYTDPMFVDAVQKAIQNVVVAIADTANLEANNNQDSMKIALD